MAFRIRLAINNHPARVQMGRSGFVPLVTGQPGQRHRAGHTESPQFGISGMLASRRSATAHRPDENFGTLGNYWPVLMLAR